MINPIKSFMPKGVSGSVKPEPVKAAPVRENPDSPDLGPRSMSIKGVMHAGGTIPETGAYLMKAKEHVLTPDKHQKLKAAMGLAHEALSHDAEEPQAPKKVVKDMKIRRSANNGHIVTHIHAHFEHPDEEHTTQGTKGLLNHVMQHMTDPTEENEEAPESKGAAAMEQAVGYKK
jgi:hypothetical protein